MPAALTTVAIRFEHDVVLARQRARQIAGLLGFEEHDQVRIATAVSEVARNAFRYARGGKVEFSILETIPSALQVRVTDSGGGIPHLREVLDGRYVSQTGMGMGILGARRLMDQFDIHSAQGQGTAVTMSKNLPPRTKPVSAKNIGSLTAQLAKIPPQDPFEELQRQNQELIATIDQVQRQKAELSELNRELEDTNRGVVALYAELDERADYLRRASELKTQFLSNMTHEFRTPLNSILSLARILLDRVDGPLGEEQEKQVKFIQKAANDLYELVNDLLDLAKVEAGKITIRPGEFSVQDLFGALRGMLRPLLAHNSSVSLTFVDPGEFPQLETDESKVSQVLRNLISNALKYTERGEVRVSASLEESQSEEHQMVTLEVADTGIGIAQADQERIFEEFTQVEGAHQQGKRGTGLGLPLSRKLAVLLGGTLTVKSEPGIGSSFSLRIPRRYQGPNVTSFVPEISGEIDPNRQPLLVVEDNRETLFIYEKFLKGSGFQPIPAATLKQAREVLAQFRPAAVILDILLAHESTWELLSELKQSQSTRKIPVMVVTMLENEYKARAMGADAFHTKPIERPWLLEQLARLAPRATPPEVLIIDDDDASRYILRSILADTRFRVLEAAEGKEGVDIARTRNPAMIFLDLKMPRMSGFQVFQTLQKVPETRNIPVVIHTSMQLTPAELKKLDGVICVIPKNHQDRQASTRLVLSALTHARVPAETNPQAYVQPA